MQTHMIMKEILIIFTYTFIIAFIAINLSKAMPYMKQRWNAFITRISRKSNARKQVDCVLLERRIQALENTQGLPDKKLTEKLVTNLIKEKTNSGLLTYHKKQMIRDMVREEVIKYLNELKK
jgi:hypothetical protein